MLISNLKHSPKRATGVFRVATECGYGPTKGSESPFATEGPEGLKWAMPHAAGRAEGGQRRRQDAHDDLNDCFPSFFFHSCEWLLVNV